MKRPFGTQLYLFGLIVAFLAPVKAPAADLKVLYSFCAQTNCQDGYEPYAGVTSAGGSLYGTTLYGGAYGSGSIFTIGKNGTEKVLYNFCPFGYPCSDGAFPYDAVLRDDKGNLYGTTVLGGLYGFGTVFELTAKGLYKVLHQFCSQTLCADGNGPAAGLIRDTKGNLYGAVGYGGGGPECFGFPGYGCGAVFKLAPNRKETILHGFCPTGKRPCADGADPFGGLVMDKSGNMYGTTTRGGGTGCFQQWGCGVVFEIPQGGEEKVLYAFQGGSDGALPSSALILDSAGNLYGTAYYGGGSGCGGNGCGAVFKIAAGGAESVLYRFCTEAACTDGASPAGALIADKQGNLYGTTEGGGITTKRCDAGCGAIFKLAPDGRESVLYSFCSQKGCADGEQPTSNLLREKNGLLTGTTNLGGANGRGALYELKVNRAR